MNFDNEKYIHILTFNFGKSSEYGCPVFYSLSIISPCKQCSIPIYWLIQKWNEAFPSLGISYITVPFNHVNSFRNCDRRLVHRPNITDNLGRFQNIRRIVCHCFCSLSCISVSIIFSHQDISYSPNFFMVYGLS